MLSMDKLGLTMDIFLPLLGLLIIIVFIVGSTIGINTLMKGKIINFLLNKKVLLIIASIISVLFTFAFVIIDDYYRSWGEMFWLVYFIGFVFLVARYTPDLVLHLKKIHQSNLEDAEEQELKSAE
tara:strand:- start:50 stop:424 length:375 start_codon:yes stop_codon:yes gene_type:complete